MTMTTTAAATETKETLTIVTFAVYRNESASIHATGCPDIKRDAQKHSGHAHGSYATIEAALLDYNADFIAEGSEGYGLDSFKIPACATRVDAANRKGFKFSKALGTYAPPAAADLSPAKKAWITRRAKKA